MFFATTILLAAATTLAMATVEFQGLPLSSNNSAAPWLMGDRVQFSYRHDLPKISLDPSEVKFLIRASTLKHYVLMGPRDQQCTDVAHISSDDNGFTTVECQLPTFGWNATNFYIRIMKANKEMATSPLIRMNTPTLAPKFNHETLDKTRDVAAAALDQAYAAGNDLQAKGDQVKESTQAVAQQATDNTKAVAQQATDNTKAVADQAKENTKAAAGGVWGAISRFFRGTAQKANQTAEAVQQKASEITDAVKRKAHNTKEAAKQKADEVSNQAADGARNATQVAAHGLQEGAEYLENQARDAKENAGELQEDLEGHKNAASSISFNAYVVATLVISNVLFVSLL